MRDRLTPLLTRRHAGRAAAVVVVAGVVSLVTLDAWARIWDSAPPDRPAGAFASVSEPAATPARVVPAPTAERPRKAPRRHRRRPRRRVVAPVVQAPVTPAATVAPQPVYTPVPQATAPPVRRPAPMRRARPKPTQAPVTFDDSG